MTSFETSKKYFERALDVSPGGVHSPVRSFAKLDGQPIFMASAEGCHLRDVDDNQFVDYCMAFGPLILGHKDPDVAAALHAAVDDGWSYGTAEAWSLELAELISTRIKWAEQIRFVNSGTEAVMSALRLARAATGRDTVIKFAGCYHGHTDAMLIQAGSGLAGKPDSAGITAGTAQDTIVLPLNDAEALIAAFKQCGDKLAAVIIEPLPANNGLLIQSTEFLQLLAERCRHHGALLIFDEVISGFRSSFGGYAEHVGIQPDIVTWGKIIGGGLPVGAFAARTDLMKHVAPLGDMYQAGTLSANPLAMRAGLATLQKLQDGKLYSQLEQLGQQLEHGVNALEGLRLIRHGSIFWLYQSRHQQTVSNADSIPADHIEAYPPLFKHLLGRGIYMPPSPYEVGFLSAAHTQETTAELVAALAALQG